MKMTEKHLEKDVPKILAELSMIEYLYNDLTNNIGCLKAKTIDKMSKESYRIHGIKEDVGDELYMANYNVDGFFRTVGLSQIEQMMLDEIVKQVISSMKGGDDK